MKTTINETKNTQYKQILTKSINWQNTPPKKQQHKQTTNNKQKLQNRIKKKNNTLPPIQK